jgi:hypothetical protein
MKFSSQAQRKAVMARFGLLWKLQYQPRVNAIKKYAPKDVYNKFQTLPITKQITIIDNMEQKGYFRNRLR